MAEKIARELPLTEFTIRRYERPHSTDMRALVKRLCLSVGLLQPGQTTRVANPDGMTAVMLIPGCWSGLSHFKSQVNNIPITQPYYNTSIRKDWLDLC